MGKISQTNARRRSPSVTDYGPDERTMSRGVSVFWVFGKKVHGKNGHGKKVHGWKKGPR